MAMNGYSVDALMEASYLSAEKQSTSPADWSMKIFSSKHFAVRVDLLWNMCKQYILVV